MPDKHQWLSKFLLCAPGPVRAPLECADTWGLIHAASHRIVSSDEKVWAKIEAEPWQRALVRA